MMKKKVLVFLLLGLALVMPVLALADGHVSWVSTYDPADGPEGIATDLNGNIFVSFPWSGQVRQIDRNGSESLLYDFAANYPGSLPLGMGTDPLGNVYVNVTTFGGPGHGVYRINRQGEAELLPGSERILAPNGMTFDAQGNLYVTEAHVEGSDPPAGAVWRIPRNGEAEMWLGPEVILGGVGYLPPPRRPIGANGICYRHNTIYVANTEKGHIVQVPVLPDGSPGEPSILVGAQGDPELLWLDDIRVDVQGTIYAALILQDRIVAIDTDTGEITDLAGAADGLSGPASLAFGKVHATQKSIFFTNSGFTTGQTGVLRLEVGVPGQP
jgi:sugar lactone lactonase YvrE